MTRVNERIRAPKIRVVLHTGEQLGIMSSREALVKAKEYGLDLVEVTAKTDPPVCRIIDYGKYKYEQAKLKKAQKSPNVSRLKEVKFRVRTEEHDYRLKVARAEKFLHDGHKVRIQLQFRGRENAHRELGFDVLNRVKEDTKTMAHVDQEPKLAGRAVVMVLSPLPKNKQVRKFTADHDEDYEDPDDADFEDEDEDGAEATAEDSEE